MIGNKSWQRAIEKARHDMAKAKRVVKVTKKAKAAPEEAPKKGKKKAAKVVEKKAKKVTPKAEKKPSRKKCVIVTDLTKAAKKAISEADAIETQIADLKDALMAKLGEVRDALGSSTFVHPDRGEMTIMTRNELTFWRAKPSGPGK